MKHGKPENWKWSAKVETSMANMYVDANMLKVAMKIKAMRVRNEAWKARKLEMEC